MTRFLLFVHLLILPALVITAVLGWGDGPADGDFTHMYWGTAVALAGLFAHSLLMFHFIAALRVVKRAHAGDPAAGPAVRTVRHLRRAVITRAMLANLMLVLQPIIGTAVYVSRLSVTWHQFGFWLSLAVSIWAVAGEWHCLARLALVLDTIGAPSPAAEQGAARGQRDTTRS